MTLRAFEGLHTILADMPAMIAPHTVSEDADTSAQTTVVNNSRRTERLSKEERKELWKQHRLTNSYRRMEAMDSDAEYYRAIGLVA